MRSGRVRVGGGVGDGVRKYDDAALSKEKGIFEERIYEVLNDT